MGTWDNRGNEGMGHVFPTFNWYQKANAIFSQVLVNLLQIISSVAQEKHFQFFLILYLPS